ncbi:MAG: hypothetical protein QM811_17430 [Pirellulales bacterium]
MPQAVKGHIRRQMKAWQVELDANRPYQELIVVVENDALSVWWNEKAVTEKFALSPEAAAWPANEGYADRNGEFGLFVENGQATFRKFEYLRETYSPGR